MGIVLIILGISGIACGYYGLYRNYKTCKFLQDLNHQCFKELMNYLDNAPWIESPALCNETYARMSEMADSIRAIPYEKVLFSFKPLKVEHWLTDEQIAFLYGAWPVGRLPIGEAVSEVQEALGDPVKSTLERERELLDKIEVRKQIEIK